MARKLTVLVVGSTGMLGFKIVTALLNKGATNVKAMVRENRTEATPTSNKTNEESRKKIDKMRDLGATIVSGDLMQPETLLPACAGVDVVVSAVGNSEATVPGQKNLIDAAKQQGVKRFIPGDYSTDYL